MRNLLGVLALAVLLAGCGSDNKTDEPKSTPTASATAEPKDAHDLQGYSEGVKRYYGEDHAHGDGVEEEYHQPPMPPETALGGPITLTGSNIGVRLVITPTKTRREGDFTAVELTVDNTGIANYEATFQNAEITYEDGKTAPLARGERASCSNGFDDYQRIEVAARAKGCLLFPRSGSAEPARLVLAIEDVPTEAGGIWALG